MLKKITLPGHGWTRRQLFAAFPMLSAVAIAGCTIRENADGTTTVTVNVAEVDAYTQAIVSGGSMIVSIAAVASALGAGPLAIINTAGSSFAASITAWDKATGGSESFTVDTTSWQSTVSSVLTNGAAFIGKLADVPAAIKGIMPDDVYSTVNTAVQGAQSAFAFLKALFSSFVSVIASARRLGAGEPRLTRVQTFRAVGLVVPVWAPALDAAEARAPVGSPRARLVRAMPDGAVVYRGADAL